MSGNISGNAYALTILSPIKEGYTPEEIAYADVVRDRLQDWNMEPNSPMGVGAADLSVSLFCIG